MCSRSFPLTLLGLPGLTVLVSVVLSQPAPAADLSAGVSVPRWKPYTSGIVTAEQLRHRTPAKAKDETEKGNKAFQRARIDDAIRHYRLAIAVDPSLVAARNNLAVCLVESDLPAAVDQLEQAVEADPHQLVLYRNLTLAYAFSSRFGDAERAGRTAMDLDRTGDQTARFLLGWVLASEHKYTAETLQLLNGASHTIPLAHLLAGGALLNGGEYAGAKKEIETYLSTNEAQFRDVANEWLSTVSRLATSQDRAESPAAR
jgi:tetratricopeptide (TPR) repeat protein